MIPIVKGAAIWQTNYSKTHQLKRLFIPA
jgi:hypothetical protein